MCVFTCRGTEVVEGVLRHHISACFAALQRKLLDLLHDALPGLRASAKGAAPAAPKPFPGAPQSSPAIEVGPISNGLSPRFCTIYLLLSSVIKVLQHSLDQSLLAGLKKDSWSRFSAARKMPQMCPDLAPAAAGLGGRC